MKYQLASKTIEKFITQHCERYMLQGRRMDQRLCLDLAQFESMASVVYKTQPELFEKHLRIYFLQKGQDLPPHSQKDGTPIWQGFAEIDLDAKVSEAKNKGLHGVEHIALENLEKLIKPYVEGAPQLELNPEGVPLVYQESELASFFQIKPIVLPEVVLPKIPEDAPTCEKKAVEKLQKEMEKYRDLVNGKNRYYAKQDKCAALKKMIHNSQSDFLDLVDQNKSHIESLLLNGDNAEYNLAVTAGLQSVASLHELSIAYLQKDLNALKKNTLLPPDLNLEQLEEALAQYFDSEIKSTLLKNALKVLEKIEDDKTSDEEKWNQSTLLYHLLSSKQFYDPKKNPELLVYECFAQKIFRNIGDGAHQINLLKEIIEKPSGIFQAITGAGKTTVLSVLRGLKAANGTNLVTFRLLPTLFEQSKAILQEQLGNAFDKRVYSIKFDLKTPLIISEKKNLPDGTTIVDEYSLFQKIYQDLLIVTHQKGCVLTDYKSFPLMQEKWIKLNREFASRLKEGSAISPIEREHWEYLRKILILFKEREETMMDEFDVPNRSCNRLQIPLGKPIELPPFLHEQSLELYEKLRNDPRLKLALDQQREIPDDTRQAVITDLAKRKAAEISERHKREGIQFKNEQQRLTDYFLGKNDYVKIDIVNQDNGMRWSEYDKDLIALYKDQFTTFLPLTLKKASGIDYKRSVDGMRIIPCHEGEGQESSRFGHPLEEINYTIQNYIQHGVSLEEFRKWIVNLQDDRKKNPNSNVPQNVFATIIHGRALPKGALNDKTLNQLLKEVNKDWSLVKKFLIPRLAELTVSGEVISMTPHDIAAMPRAVSGLSATLGCVEELPASFNASEASINGMMGEMVYRLLERTGTNTKPLEYDPEKPFEVLDKERFHAIIDGAGAFRGYPASTVAEELQSKQSHLKRVGYHNESQLLDYIGKPDCSLSQKGFYFSKAKTIGADVGLGLDAKAVLTVDRHKTLENLAQNDGRMRLKGQKIQIAQSSNNPTFSNTEQLIVNCARNEGAIQSIGLFRSKLQEIHSVVRQEAYDAFVGHGKFGSNLG